MIRLAVFMLLLFCISASADARIGNGRSEKKQRGKKITMVGCIVEKDGHMMMTDKEHPGGVVLMSSGDIDIKAHVGQMMRVAGIMITMGNDGTIKVGQDKMQIGEMMGIKLESMKMKKGTCDMDR